MTTRAKAELKRAVHDAAATLRAPETERRVKQGLPYAVAAMAILTVVLLGLAAYYFVDGRLDAWRAQKASAPVAAPAPEPLPAPLAAEPEPAPPVVAEPEAGSLAAASVAVKRTRKRPVPVRGTTAPAPPTTGEVAITSVPEGALVQIDGQGDGSWRTPLVARSLSPGAHTITLTKPGYAAHAQAVPVEAGKRMAFAASLTELGATVAVTSSPPGAHILVDGKETGRLTPTKLVLPAGNHSFSLRRAGYFEYTSQAQLAAGQNAQVEAALKVMGNVDEVKTAGRFNKLLGRPKDMASLQIKTRPKGGRVVINGRTMEKNTPAEFFLPPGQYEVVVTVEGYQPLRKTVNLESASKTVVDQALQK